MIFILVPHNRTCCIPGMTLSEWLKSNNVTQVEFARRIGISQSNVSRFCGDNPRWPSRADMQKIYAETDRAVTPLDFLFPNNGEQI